MSQGYKNLKVFQLAYKLAMEIFEISKTFPKEEKYSLTDQIKIQKSSCPKAKNENTASCHCQLHPKN
ncbi:MAG TPA: four helix bundle protein [Balneolaceae bacterium]|nr:four helix bundle protein [Balneolaceae bacterium]